MYVVWLNYLCVVSIIDSRLNTNPSLSHVVSVSLPPKGVKRFCLFTPLVINDLSYPLRTDLSFSKIRKQFKVFSLNSDMTPYKCDAGKSRQCHEVRRSLVYVDFNRICYSRINRVYCSSNRTSFKVVKVLPLFLRQRRWKGGKDTRVKVIPTIVGIQKGRVEKFSMFF